MQPRLFPSHTPPAFTPKDEEYQWTPPWRKSAEAAWSDALGRMLTLLHSHVFSPVLMHIRMDRCG